MSLFGLDVWRIQQAAEGSVYRPQMMARVLLVAGALALFSALPQSSKAQSAGATAPAKPAAAKSKAGPAASAAKNTPLPAPPQLLSVGPVTDVDPHKAFGSK